MLHVNKRKQSRTAAQVKHSIFLLLIFFVFVFFVWFIVLSEGLSCKQCTFGRRVHIQHEQTQAVAHCSTSKTLVFAVTDLEGGFW